MYCRQQTSPNNAWRSQNTITYYVVTKFYLGMENNRNKNWDGGMQERAIQIPSIPILVSVIVLNLHLKDSFQM